MAKFKIGDQLECIYPGKGFDKATVMNVYTESKGKYKGSEMYLFKISCGTATVPTVAEYNYKIKET